MDAIEVISTKRDGGRLSDDQIDWVIRAYTDGVVADEQMSALAMAILLNGMDRDEISRWTAAMIASGQRMDFSSLGRPTADKKEDLTTISLTFRQNQNTTNTGLITKEFIRIQVENMIKTDGISMV